MMLHKKRFMPSHKNSNKPVKEFLKSFDVFDVMCLGIGLTAITLIIQAIITML